MTEPAPPPGDPVLRFFANALIAIGWLVLTLGGLCTLIFGVLSVVGVGDAGGHASLEDWSLPLGMLAFGGGALWIGRKIKRDLTKPPGQGPDA